MAKPPKRYLLFVTLRGSEYWAPTAGTRARIVGGWYNHICNLQSTISISIASAKVAVVPISAIALVKDSIAGYLNDYASDDDKYTHNVDTTQIWIHRGWVIVVAMGTGSKAQLAIEVEELEEPLS